MRPSITEKEAQEAQASPQDAARNRNNWSSSKEIKFNTSMPKLRRTKHCYLDFWEDYPRTNSSVHRMQDEDSQNIFWPRVDREEEDCLSEVRIKRLESPEVKNSSRENRRQIVWKHHWCSNINWPRPYTGKFLVPDTLRKFWERETPLRRK